MHCKNCLTILPDTAAMTFCPLCGEALHPERQKPSFERTWAQMQADQMKCHPSRSGFDEAWGWYEKAIQANPHETVWAADFVRRYPAFLPDMSWLESQMEAFLASLEPAWQQQARSLTPWKKLLLWGSLQQDAPSALQLVWHDSKTGELVQEALKESKALAAGFFDPDESKIRDPFDISLHILAQRLQGHYGPARKALCAFLYPQDPNAVICLGSAKATAALSGLSMDCHSRLLQIEKAMEQQNLEEVLQGVYRPLEGQDNPFEHLFHLPAGLNDFLKAHHNAWIEQTEKLLDSDQALRGIHLALQTIKNQEDADEEVCEQLLARQYEKAYLRPFSQIEKTDRNWN